MRRGKTIRPQWLESPEKMTQVSHVAVGNTPVHIPLAMLAFGRKHKGFFSQSSQAQDSSALLHAQELKAVVESSPRRVDLWQMEAASPSVRFDDEASPAAMHVADPSRKQGGEMQGQFMYYWTFGVDAETAWKCVLCCTLLPSCLHVFPIDGPAACTTQLQALGVHAACTSFVPEHVPVHRFQKMRDAHPLLTSKRKLNMLGYLGKTITSGWFCGAHPVRSQVHSLKVGAAIGIQGSHAQQLCSSAEAVCQAGAEKRQR